MNKFDNDGSFLDQFMKENKDKCEQEQTRERSAALQKPIKVTWKMKGQMGGIKKKSIATLMKEGPSKKAEVDDGEETMKTLTKGYLSRYLEALLLFTKQSPLLMCSGFTQLHKL